MTNEEMFQNIESFTVGLDDTFAFHCTQCGKCCIHRTDIILSPRDIFKMAKELKHDTDYFISASTKKCIPLKKGRLSGIMLLQYRS